MPSNRVLLKAWNNKLGLEENVRSTDNALDVNNVGSASLSDVVRSANLKESIDNMVSQLKILNTYMALGFDTEITGEDKL